MGLPTFTMTFLSRTQVYLVTPNGSLQKYNPQNGEITIVSNDMPSDPNDPTRVNENTINYIEPIENDINKYTIY